jgi:hypothetical protein
MKMKMKILQKTKQFLARNQGAIALGTVTHVFSPF